MTLRGMASIGIGILLVAGCTSGSPGDPPSASATSAQGQGVGQVLHCDLVGSDMVQDVDDEGMWGATADEAVAALVDSLGLHQARVEQWTPPGASPSIADPWPLFAADGSGYGTASVTPTDDGQWSASIDQWCSDVVPLPVASDVSAPPTATVPLDVPPAPGPQSETLALATYDAATGPRSTTGIVDVDPEGAFVVRAGCLATDPGITVQYSVLVDGHESGLGEVVCDGTGNVNGVILPGGDAQQVHVALDSEAFDHVIQAYAAVVPE